MDMIGLPEERVAAVISGPVGVARAAVVVLGKGVGCEEFEVVVCTIGNWVIGWSGMCGMDQMKKEDANRAAAHTMATGTV